MKKVVYIIPEYLGSLSNPAYKSILSVFKQVGIKPIPVELQWKRRIMTQYVSEFMDIYNAAKKEGDQTYLFGFSYGAYIAFLAAIKIKPKAVFLCSISPYFKEDLNDLYKSWIRMSGKARIIDHKKYVFDSLAKKFNSKAFIFVGDAEQWQLMRRAKIAHKLIKNSKLIIIPKARHRIGQREYQNAIKNIIISELK